MKTKKITTTTRIGSIVTITLGHSESDFSTTSNGTVLVLKVFTRSPEKTPVVVNSLPSANLPWNVPASPRPLSVTFRSLTFPSSISLRSLENLSASRGAGG
jgi:hypothetical protein